MLILAIPRLDTFHNDGLLGIFTGLNLVAFILIFFFVRETAGATVGNRARSSESFLPAIF